MALVEPYRYQSRTSSRSLRSVLATTFISGMFECVIHGHSRPSAPAALLGPEAGHLPLGAEHHRPPEELRQHPGLRVHARFRLSRQPADGIKPPAGSVVGRSNLCYPPEVSESPESRRARERHLQLREKPGLRGERGVHRHARVRFHHALVRDGVRLRAGGDGYHGRPRDRGPPSTACSSGFGTAGPSSSSPATLPSSTAAASRMRT